jgi:hypothetical protein
MEVEVIREHEAEIEQLETEAAIELSRANTLVLHNGLEYEDAAVLAIGLRQRMKAVEDWFAPLIKPQRQALDALYEKQREVVKPLDQAIRVVEGKLTDYRSMIEAESRRQAELERIRLEEEALKRREEAALAAIDSGDEERAEKIIDNLDAPVAAPPPQPVEVAAPKTRGMVERVDFKVEVTDLSILCQAIGAGTLPSNLVKPDMVKLKALAKAHDGDSFSMPGVSVERVVKVGTRR